MSRFAVRYERHTRSQEIYWTTRLQVNRNCRLLEQYTILVSRALWWHTTTKPWNWSFWKFTFSALIYSTHACKSTAFAGTKWSTSRINDNSFVVLLFGAIYTRGHTKSCTLQALAVILNIQPDHFFWSSILKVAKFSTSDRVRKRLWGREYTRYVRNNINNTNSWRNYG